MSHLRAFTWVRSSGKSNMWGRACGERWWGDIGNTSLHPPPPRLHSRRERAMNFEVSLERNQQLTCKVPRSCAPCVFELEWMNKQAEIACRSQAGWDEDQARDGIWPSSCPNWLRGKLTGSWPPLSQPPGLPESSGTGLFPEHSEKVGPVHFSFKRRAERERDEFTLICLLGDCLRLHLPADCLLKPKSEQLSKNKTICVNRRLLERGYLKERHQQTPSQNANMVTVSWIIRSIEPYV